MSLIIILMSFIIGWIVVMIILLLIKCIGVVDSTLMRFS